MINKFPKDVIQYMVDNIPPFSGILIINTDTAGFINKWYGSYEKYISIIPKTNDNILEIFPFLEGMIPLPTDTLQLPNIQLSDKNYADIHILSKKNGDHWLFFMNRSNDVESIRELIQKMNEIKLKEEKEEKNSDKYCFDNPFGLTYLFDIQIFIKKHNNFFIPLGKTTSWIEEIAPQIKKSVTHGYNITDLFPFLEVFFDEANSHWKSGSETMLHSGTWIEQTITGKELFLKATALCQNNKEYLLIRLLNDDMTEEQGVIQKAREQQLLYEKLAKTKSRLKQLLDYKERFVSIISHDLRSPVASVLGITEMLTNDEELLDKVDNFSREMLLGIHEEMLRLLDYNDKLYHWSNLELGNFEIVLEPINLHNLIDKALKTGERKMEAKQIKFENKIDDNIVVKVDITLFLQALNNLLSNSIKFTPKHGKIIFDAIVVHKKILLSLTDNGLGMPQKVCETLFDDNLRATTLGTYGEKGSGLGIGIVKKIVDAHNFTITVNSEEGKGTTFTISLPLFT